jgi:transposase-like protein
MDPSGKPSAESLQRSAARVRRYAPGVRKSEVDTGRRGGVPTEERVRIKELERENRELRQTNEILRKASAFFAQAELDRRPR